jgi:hypothetical protein
MSFHSIMGMARQRISDHTERCQVNWTSFWTFIKDPSVDPFSHRLTHLISQILCYGIGWVRFEPKSDFTCKFAFDRTGTASVGDVTASCELSREVLPESSHIVDAAPLEKHAWYTRAAQGAILGSEVELAANLHPFPPSEARHPLQIELTLTPIPNLV